MTDQHNCICDTEPGDDLDPACPVCGPIYWQNRRQEMPERLTPEQIERLIGNLGDVARSVSVFGDQLGAADIKLAAAALAQMREENRELRKYLDKRASGTDPLTLQLQQRAEQAEQALERLREKAGNLRALVNECDGDRAHPSWAGEANRALDELDALTSVTSQESHS